MNLFCLALTSLKCEQLQEYITNYSKYILCAIKQLTFVHYVIIILCIQRVHFVISEFPFNIKMDIFQQGRYLRET